LSRHSVAKKMPDVIFLFNIWFFCLWFFPKTYTINRSLYF